KGDGGRRRVRVGGGVRDELLAVRADGARTLDQDAYVFPTRSGRRLPPENFRKRVLAPAVKRGDENLAKRGRPPLPVKLTPHSLRRTFASLLYALGESPPVVMQEMGHTDPALALRIYAQAIRRTEAEQAALVEGSRAAGGGEFVSMRVDEAESGSEAPQSEAGD